MTPLSELLRSILARHVFLFGLTISELGTIIAKVPRVARDSKPRSTNFSGGSSVFSWGNGGFPIRIEPLPMGNARLVKQSPFTIPVVPSPRRIILATQRAAV